LANFFVSQLGIISMSMPISVAEAAKLLNVTEATVNRYVREEGLPTVTRGSAGAGHKTTIDLARILDWKRRRAENHLIPWVADGSNPIRKICEIQHTNTIRIITNCLLAAYHREFPDLGITGEQAFRLYGVIVGSLAQYITGGALEKYIGQQLFSGYGGDIDDFCNCLFACAVSTKWTEAAASIPLPEEMIALMPKKAKDEYAKIKAERKRK
jgi:hypothetical protein